MKVGFLSAGEPQLPLCVSSSLYVGLCSIKLAGLIHTAEESKRDRKPVRPLMPRLILGMVSFPPHSIGHSKSLGQHRFKAGGLDSILDEKKQHKHNANAMWTERPFMGH